MPDFPLTFALEGAQLAEDSVQIHVLRILQIGHGEPVAVYARRRDFRVERAQLSGGVDGVQALQNGLASLGVRKTKRRALPPHFMFHSSGLDYPFDSSLNVHSLSFTFVLETPTPALQI